MPLQESWTRPGVKISSWSGWGWNLSSEKNKRLMIWMAPSALFFWGRSMPWKDPCPKNSTTLSSLPIASWKWGQPVSVMNSMMSMMNWLENSKSCGTWLCLQFLPNCIVYSGKKITFGLHFSKFLFVEKIELNPDKIVLPVCKVMDVTKDHFLFLFQTR